MVRDAAQPIGIGPEARFNGHPFPVDILLRILGGAGSFDAEQVITRRCCAPCAF
ncbi:hypothetical protein D3C81_1900980 [compost metagenome]